ncbi:MULTISPECIES: hypothetical protein [unclassified Ensifer]|jgi:hypothetical protein|uniref:hypothetical protein n=1 Tax=unclassified Ensifer TaxID=2633371 RepID=UPI0012E334CB|nr:MULTISPECIES: hypothetical protein [unclassified Ensifer]MBV7522693.1 hypothetical protein [Ensifer sp. ENS12]
MIAVSQTVRKRTTELLAILVALLFLAVPKAEATPIECGPHIAGSEHVVSPQVKADLHAEKETDDQKACCKRICSLCHALFPAPIFGEVTLKSGGRRDLTPHPPINGIISRPAIGPPRSAG